MSKSFCTYFEVEVKKSFKDYLIQNKEIPIYSDHFTKYGIDIIRREYSNSFNITNIEQIELLKYSSAIIIFNEKHSQELQWQGYEFPYLERVDISKKKVS